MRTLRPSLFVALTLAFVGCAVPRNPWGTSREDREFAQTTVVVTNNNWATVIVYAVNLGTVYRLGSVETGVTTTFLLPRSAAVDGDLELRAHPVGLRVDHSTGPILFEPGETIDFTIENLLELSTVVVY